jgi:hypothetical protein
LIVIGFFFSCSGSFIACRSLIIVPKANQLG